MALERHVPAEQRQRRRRADAPPHALRRHARSGGQLLAAREQRGGRGHQFKRRAGRQFTSGRQRARHHHAAAEFPDERERFRHLHHRGDRRGSAHLPMVLERRSAGECRRDKSGQRRDHREPQPEQRAGGAGGQLHRGRQQRRRHRHHARLALRAHTGRSGGRALHRLRPGRQRLVDRADQRHRTGRRG